MLIVQNELAGFSCSSLGTRFCCALPLWQRLFGARLVQTKFWLLCLIMLLTSCKPPHEPLTYLLGLAPSHLIHTTMPPWFVNLYPIGPGKAGFPEVHQQGPLIYFTWLLTNVQLTLPEPLSFPSSLSWIISCHLVHEMLWTGSVLSILNQNNSLPKYR